MPKNDNLVIVDKSKKIELKIEVDENDLRSSITVILETEEKGEEVLYENEINTDKLPLISALATLKGLQGLKRIDIVYLSTNYLPLYKFLRDKHLPDLSDSVSILLFETISIYLNDHFKRAEIRFKGVIPDENEKSDEENTNDEKEEDIEDNNDEEKEIVNEVQNEDEYITGNEENAF